MRRLPLKSSRCLTGSPLPSPEDRATAPAAAPACEFRLAVEPGRVADLAQQGGGCDGADARLVAQGGAVTVEQLVDETLQSADLAASSAVLVDERLQPGEPVPARWGRGCVGVDPFEAAQPGFDLAGRGELVAHLGGQLGDLVADVVEHQSASSHKGSAVFEHRLDLRDGRVVGLQGLHRAQRRLGQQRAGRRDGVDGVGLVEPPRAALGRRPRSGDLAGVEPGRAQRDRDVRSPLRRAFDTDPADAVGVEQVDRGAVAGGGVRECVVSDLDAVRVDDPHGEGVLVRVDSPDCICHGVLLLEVKLRWVPERQGRFVTTESPQSGSLLDRSAPAGPTLDATGQTTGTRPKVCGVIAERRTGP